ncbi:Putative arylamine N-acetyltransferase, papain-like cysteine peptidase superfamily [Septoria linicola]|uniref:Arylamine N-acetyltransferase, papain-like cysteine peptidase superfamily n=1 Tax=Septoria linicola TaxID=215465 RepID=A0A9Q9EPQ4_9PEZI|nr:putative arylamine N-acetyltransferase, papain-like cysteine peptidase superfamily [Septoria linicola]USW59011.1 Putative arylamine N-acetyltransferase, papain-like cysteine peptidase superfamily [Septoria linicola]
MAAVPSTFTEEQIAAFLTLIGLPSKLQKQRYNNDAAADLHLLQQLHIHAISTVPYENLTLHYNKTHTITIKPQLSYAKIVTDGRGRGGYCMENSIFYNHILRGLGFPAYLAAVRIRHRVDGVPQGGYSGWVHLVNLVTLSDGTRWAVDVGFGGDGATEPIQLVRNKPQTNLGPQQIRLFRDHIPTPEQKWNSFFAFNETEATERDFHNINSYAGSHPESFPTFTCIIMKFLRRLRPGHGSDQEIYGKRTLVSGIVKENLGGKTKKWFGITFTDEEVEGIKGWGTELRDGPPATEDAQDEIWRVRRGKQLKLEYQESIA